MTDTATKVNQPTINLNGKTLSGATVLSFGPDNVLFVGDSKAGVVHAIPTKAAILKDPVPFNGHAIDRAIAKILGVPPSDLIINDMQIHPVSQEAYITIKNGHAPNAKSLIAIVSPTNNEVRFLTIPNSRKQQVSIKDPLTKDFNFYRDFPASTLNITCLLYTSDAADE